MGGARAVIEPFTSAIEVTVSDGDRISPTRGIMVGVTGDVRVDMAGGGTVTLAGLPVGVVFPVSVIRIYATGTTATGIIALR